MARNRGFSARAEEELRVAVEGRRITETELWCYGAGGETAGSGAAKDGGRRIFAGWAMPRLAEDHQRLRSTVATTDAAMKRIMSAAGERGRCDEEQEEGGFEIYCEQFQKDGFPEVGLRVALTVSTTSDDRRSVGEVRKSS